jgi:Rod binding domain-containing protein
MPGLTIPLLSEVTINRDKPVSPRKDEPGRVEYASRQFEALMISEMMKSIREAEEGGPMGEKDQSAGSVLQLGDEQFAQALAARGGLGLARIFTHAFQPKDSKNE